MSGLNLKSMTSLRGMSVYIIGVMTLSLLFQPLAGAAYMGQLNDNQGYFNTSYTTTSVGDSVMPAAERCDYTYTGGVGWNSPTSDLNSSKNSLPLNQVNTKQKYFNYLQARYNGNRCGGWDRLGVAFVVHTMLGHPPGSSRTLSSADWNALQTNIISNSAVGMTYVGFSNSSLNSHSNGFHDFGSREDASFYTGSALGGPTLVFAGPNGYRYEVKLRCANPTGAMRTNVVVAPQWTIAQQGAHIQEINSAGNPIGPNLGTSAAGQVGKRYGFFQSWRNNGPNSTTAAINIGRNYAYPTGSGDTATMATVASGRAVGTIFSGLVGHTSTIPQSSIGGSYCLQTRVQPRAYNNSGILYGTRMCVNVPFSYNLTPRVAPLVDVSEPGSALTVRSYVRNNGPTNSRPSQWQLSKLVLSPGQPTPSGANSAAAPCAHFGAGSCDRVDGGTNQTFNVGEVQAPVGGYGTTVDDLPVGTKICFAMSVQPRAVNSNNWQHSPPQCLVIGKKPKTQIWGGDLISSKYVNSSASTKDISGMPRTFGSWVEYGIFAVRDITGAASGSAYAGVGLANAGKCNTSYLSFTNSGNRTCSPSTPIGNYANSSSIPDVAASFPTTASTPSFGANDLSVQSQNGVFRVNGVAISLSGGNIQKGRWVVINAPAATVTITGDIKYTEGQLLSVGDIPQVIIIANKIIINGNVTRVDAWLIASGTDGIIETCNVNSSNYVLTGTDRLTANKCNSPLVVNGPVMAKQLWLRRTGGSGSGPASGDPAEVFNLRPDAYMWASLRASGNNRVQTVYSTELPPRL